MERQFRVRVAELALIAVIGFPMVFVGGVGWEVPASPTQAYVFGFCMLSVSIALAACVWSGWGKDLFAPETWLVIAGSALPAILAQGEPVTFERVWLVNAAILLTAIPLGAMVGTRIQIAGYVLAVVLVSSLVDAWSVFDARGVSAQIAAEVMREPERMSALVMYFPLLGTRSFAPLIGAGDALFSGLYAAALTKHAVPRWRTFCGLLAGLLTGMSATLWLARPLPLLPFMGAGVLCTDRRLSSLEPRDRRTLLISVGVLAVFVASRIAR